MSIPGFGDSPFKMFGLPDLKLPSPPPGAEDFLASLSSLGLPPLPPPKESLQRDLKMMVNFQKLVEQEIEKMDPELFEGEREVPGSKIWRLFDAREKLDGIIPGLLILQDEVDNFVPEPKDAKGKWKWKWKGKGKGKGSGVEEDDELDNYIRQRTMEILRPDRDIVYFFRLKWEGVLPSKFVSDVLGGGVKGPSPSTSGTHCQCAGGKCSSSSSGAAGGSRSPLGDIDEDDETTPTIKRVELPNF
ncbi:hypothetical protein DFP72DRAFT_889975 [Ephemerocybe angulata]|uniref:Uncharacterized protein n=1 Tax=Ephemerocybe angulata TaxID=980116 RepID=A0A8H6I3G1_9AGAR|nr:hypothetical protein DFP72DRAFT_889975 [Tulosesus angulatus]